MAAILFDDRQNMVLVEYLLGLDELEGQAIQREAGASGGLQRQANASFGVINGFWEEVDVETSLQLETGRQFNGFDPLLTCPNIADAPSPLGPRTRASCASTVWS